MKSKIFVAMFLGGLATIVPQAGYPFATGAAESVAALAQLARDAKTSHPQTAGLDAPADVEAPIARDRFLIQFRKEIRLDPRKDRTGLGVETGMADLDKLNGKYSVFRVEPSLGTPSNSNVYVFRLPGGVVDIKAAVREYEKLPYVLWATPIQEISRQNMAGDLGFEASGWSEFPRPDAPTQAWLASRIPGLNVQQLRVVPFDAADRMLRRAVASQATYLDVLSDPILRQGNAEVYYVPQDVLERLDGHYISGTLPAAGTAVDGRPFHMQALVSGGGYANFLYDQPAGFSFKDGENEIKIGAAGNVSARIRGPADIALQGIAGCGCVFIFCGCADIQGMTKVSDSKMIVQTSRGPQNQDIFPIRAR